MYANSKPVILNGMASLNIQSYDVLNGNRSGLYSETIVGANVVNPTFTIAASTTQTIAATAFPIANLLAYSLSSDDGNVTVNFNTTGSPVSLALTAGATPLRWSESQGACPISSNVTGISVSNATTSTTDLNLIILVST